MTDISIPSKPLLTRRQMLQNLAGGFGSVVLADLLAREGRAGEDRGDEGRGPLAPKVPHHQPRARRVIFLFMAGAPGQMDTFDYKPVLQRMSGKTFARGVPGVIKKFAVSNGVLFGSPFRFRQCGESGQWVSELLPRLSEHVDDLCILKGMHTEGFDHGQAGLFFHTGASNFVRPSLGSWVSYGLGTENESLPSFIHLGPSVDYGGHRIHAAAFLPSAHQGTAIGSDSLPAAQFRLRNLRNQNLPRAVQAKQMALLRAMHERYRRRVAADAPLDGWIQSLETAFRMQVEAADVLDLERETRATHALYGLGHPDTDDFGRQCLMARRLSEAGVRFVLVTHSIRKQYPSVREWDQHQNLKRDHRRNARQIDRPIAALLTDLKQRGLLDETLVVWAGEFGRTPMIELVKNKPNQITKESGRNHNPLGFTIWLAGGGVKSGFSYGATDEIGYRAVEGRVHTHDLHATLLYLLGLDHRRLTYRYAGLDVRLTGVKEARVVREILS